MSDQREGKSLPTPTDFDVRAFALEKAIHVRPIGLGQHEDSEEAPEKTIARAAVFEGYLRNGYTEKEN